MRKLLLLSIFAGVFALSACNNRKNMENEAKAFLTQYDSIITPLSKELNLASWEAAINATPENFARVEALSKKLNGIYSSKNDFAALKKFKDSKNIKDSLVKRQVEVLYNAYLGNQVDTSLLNQSVKMQSAIEQKYTNFRAEVNGKKVNDNQIEEILKNSTNSADLQKAWEGHKAIGSIVDKDIIALVKKRNEIAKSVGFNNYHEMSLKLSEQDPAEVSKLFDELDQLTKDAFVKLKGEIDDYLASRLHISKEQLMPWHYQDRFFQEGPAIYKVDLDKYYKGKDLAKLTADYYTSIGFDVNDIMSKSSLYPKEGKNQHAFCTDIDNKGDVRVLCNIQPNLYWMNTMLHEFGHAIYDKYIDMNLPFSLRNPAHQFTTEAVAMIFGRRAANADFLKSMGLVNEAEAKQIAADGFKVLRLQQLVFSRWAQVMYRFEKGMYENPDQDLNKLWWDLVEKYQMMKRPANRNAPDWASKIHIASYPCYYHNYLLGELLASQMQHYVVTNVIKTADANDSFYGKKEAGQFFLDKIFKPGALYPWNTMIEKATGEKLTAKYYAEQFVK